MTAPDDALAAIEAHGVQSADDALAMADAILDPENDGVEWLMQHGCDVMDHLRAEVRSLRAHVASEPERTAAAAAQWRAVDEDTAFAPPFSTIRVCRGCGCLVVGGPTVCNRCAESPTGGA